ncbi:hypothetical protein Celf_2165 [Cellulomonas fimi ATCC 484]|uniref:Uncharacterized protein n=1 Tax=Cellulomonas fimi (strain ATCC 484 / DSM 20113 / JCM 1341 / CCUG 24087 / LMG 16345 / NBRC 15513 / NCIMB 8980 / NCTC 7547 / NRS-133) TaxID=590998 RepID=F4H1J4_CELFA|nr:hypothetical protein Celf_2165 [Cellulomonas fimi ATCC 484]VEH32405.1 Uncharacterised protein [Cellulomonas fimi]
MDGSASPPPLRVPPPAPGRPDYPGPVPRPSTSALLLALAVTGAATACSTSAPATLDPTDAATASVSAQPSPTESLLPEQEVTGSAVGALADGFPTDLVPLPAGAEVLVSSARPVEGTDLLEISLNLRTAQDAAGLLEAVRAPLLAAGFAEAAPPAPEAGLAAQTTFSRGDGSELLVVGVLDRDEVRTLTLGGRVRPATA